MELYSKIQLNCTENNVFIYLVSNLSNLSVIDHWMTSSVWVICLTILYFHLKVLKLFYLLIFSCIYTPFPERIIVSRRS